MNDAELPSYQPDDVLKHRREEHMAKPKTPLTVEKPVSFRVMKVRPGTRTKHYSKKPKTRSYDPRHVKFY